MSLTSVHATVLPACCRIMDYNDGHEEPSLGNELIAADIEAHQQQRVQAVAAQGQASRALIPAPNPARFRPNSSGFQLQSRSLSDISVALCCNCWPAVPHQAGSVAARW